MRGLSAATHSYTSRRRRDARSVVWTTQYEANELPQNASPVWTFTESITNTIEISPAGFLHVTSVDEGYPEYSMTPSVAFDGFTFETRMKVINGQVNDYQGANTNGASYIFASDKNAKGELYIYSDAVVVVGNTIDTVSLDTTDAYHTYRLTVNDTELKLYIDGVLESSIVPTDYTVTAVEFSPEIFGVPSIETSWDYVYYRTDGAFAP